MARDINTEVAALEILNRLYPTPLKELTLSREIEIAIDRQLTRDDYQDVLRTLSDRKLIARGEDRIGLPIVWITDTGRAALIR